MASQTFQRIYFDILSERLPGEGDQTILDIGSKDGEIIARLASQFDCRGVGVDLRFDLTTTSDSASFLEADAFRLPFNDESFDAVICNMVFEHIPDEDAVIREVKRVLSPDGVFVLIFPNRVFPLEGHAYPHGVQWLPKPLAQLIVDRTVRADRAEYFRDAMFYVSNLGVRRELEAEFTTVTFEGDRLLDAVSTGSGWKATALHAASPVLRSGLTIPGVDRAVEAAFPVGVYTATGQA